MLVSVAMTSAWRLAGLVGLSDPSESSSESSSDSDSNAVKARSDIPSWKSSSSSS